MTTCSCGRNFASSPVLLVHQRGSGHCFCKLCNRQFDSELSLASHRNKKHGGSSSGSQKLQKSLQEPPKAKEEAKSWACPQCARSFADQGSVKDHCSVAHSHKCGACSRAYINLKGLHVHQRLSKHLYCRQCDQCFSKPSALDKHQKTVIHAAEFHCCDCDRVFKTQKALDQHRQDQGHIKVKKVHECNECQREFPSEAALRDHQSSLVHKPLSDLKCTAGAKCKQRFNSPSALMHHLENGCCRSGLTRKEFNQLVQKNDTDRLSSSGPAERDIAKELHDRLSSLTLTSNPVRTPIPSKDATPIMTPTSDTGSGVPLSPYLRNSSPSPALSFTDVSEIPTRPSSRNTGLFCLLCPERTKPFSTVEALEMHLASTKHAP